MREAVAGEELGLSSLKRENIVNAGLLICYLLPLLLEGASRVSDLQSRQLPSVVNFDRIGTWNPSQRTWIQGNCAEQQQVCSLGNNRKYISNDDRRTSSSEQTYTLQH